MTVTWIERTYLHRRRWQQTSAIDLRRGIETTTRPAAPGRVPPFRRSPMRRAVWRPSVSAVHCCSRQSTLEVGPPSPCSMRSTGAAPIPDGGSIAGDKGPP